MPPAEPRPSRNFRLLATSQEEEDAYDIRVEREKLTTVKFTSLIGSIAHIVKGALGGGILSSHVSYKKAGVAVAIPLNVFFGVYMGYCLYLLVDSAQTLYRRTKIPMMSYADVGEASCMLFPNPKIHKFARPFRYCIDAIICMDLFGSCCVYQIIISKQVKQLVENTHSTGLPGKGPGFPDLRIYLAIFIPLIIAICLIRHLKYLAPFSIVANLVIVVAIMMAVQYAFTYNPQFQNLELTTTKLGIFEYIGMSVFSMSCAGVVIPIENHMDNPKKYPLALTVGMSLIIFCIFMTAFFGYAAFLAESVSPITLNFPMDTMPKILKGLIAMMIYVTHALNFWVPFNLCFYYLKRFHNPARIVLVELCYRALFVTLIGLVAIVFPEIDAIMGFNLLSGNSLWSASNSSSANIESAKDSCNIHLFVSGYWCSETPIADGLVRYSELDHVSTKPTDEIGCFCLSNMAFIWPNVICLLVIWDRPGFGPNKWRLWRAIVLTSIGLFIFVCGSMVNAVEVVSVFIQINL